MLHLYTTIYWVAAMTDAPSDRLVRRIAGQPHLRPGNEGGQVLQAVHASSWVNSTSSLGEESNNGHDEEAIEPNDFLPLRFTSPTLGSVSPSQASRGRVLNPREFVSNMDRPPDEHQYTAVRDHTPEPEQQNVGGINESLITNEHTGIRPNTDPGEESVMGYLTEFQRNQSSPFLALTFITLPIAAAPVILMALIFIYRVPRGQSVFTWPPPVSPIFVLVDFKDTRLMFIASSLSFITPLVAAYIMSLYSPRIVEKLRTGDDFSIHELALLGAQCTASPRQLYKACLHGCISSTPINKALKFARNAHLKLFIFGLWTYAALAVLHLTTETVNYYQATTTGEYFPSRGLSSHCLDYDRLTHHLPCSSEYSNPDWASQVLERFRIQRNTSEESRIDFVQESMQQRELGIIVPAQVPSNVDFRASTYGLCTECDYITKQCAMHFASEDVDDPMSYWTIFNCSESFYGVLGKNPVIVDSLTANDSDIPLLGFKPFLRLQVGYHIDPGLQYGYNPVGYDAALNVTQPALPDMELVNPVFLGVAGRIGFNGLGRKFRSSDLFIHKHTYIDFAMRCKMTMFEVNYTRLNSTLTDLSLSDTNGSIFEIFHGVQYYDILTSTAWELQEVLAQSGLQNTTAKIAREWEHLFTIKVLGVVGSVLEKRQALLQQSRKHLLVARVPWPALGFLCFCTLLYVGAGVSSVYSRRKIDGGTALMAKALGTPGAGFSACLGVEHRLEVMVKDYRLDPRTSTSRAVINRNPGALKVELLP